MNSLIYIIHHLKVKFILTATNLPLHSLHHFIPKETGTLAVNSWVTPKIPFPGLFWGMGLTSLLYKIVRPWVQSALSFSFFHLITYYTKPKQKNPKSLSSVEIPGYLAMISLWKSSAEKVKKMVSPEGCLSSAYFSLLLKADHSNGICVTYNKCVPRNKYEWHILCIVR